MRKIIRKLVFLFIMAFLIYPNLLLAQSGAAGVVKGYGLETTAKEAFGQDYKPRSLQDFLASIVSQVLALLGVVFLILIIYAGIAWMTAAGDQEKVTKARKIMINATIGLAIVLMAYMITYFITKTLITTVTA